MTLPETEEPPHKQEIIHWTWEEDDNESLCGLDMKNEPWTPTNPVNCPKCIEIDMLCEMWDDNNE